MSERDQITEQDVEVLLRAAQDKNAPSGRYKRIPKSVPESFHLGGKSASKFSVGDFVVTANEHYGIVTEVMLKGTEHLCWGCISKDSFAFVHITPEQCRGQEALCYFSAAKKITNPAEIEKLQKSYQKIKVSYKATFDQGRVKIDMWDANDERYKPDEKVYFSTPQAALASALNQFEKWLEKQSSCLRMWKRFQEQHKTRKSFTCSWWF
jgi:hypothetical protein